MTKLLKIFWGVVGVLFAGACVAINCQLKYIAPHQEVSSAQMMGNIKVGQLSPDCTLEDLA